MTISQHTENPLGRPVSRIDGPLKVTGQALYAGEYRAPDLLHGVIVSSAIARGRIISIDGSAALALPGVMQVFTHENRPQVSDRSKDYLDEVAPPGSPFRPLGSDRVFFSAQPIALVVADSFESARDAAALVKVDYASEPHLTDLDRARADAYIPPKQRSGISPPTKPVGHFASAFAASPVTIAADYRVPFEHHNAMELFATTCVWNGDGTLTVYDKTQGALNTQQYLMHVFDLKKERVRVVNRFVGGAFGSALRPQHQAFFAVMATCALERSVRVVMTREQMFTFTHRPHTLQSIALGATWDGKLQALRHHAVGGTSSYEDYQEVAVNWSTLQYHCDNTDPQYKIAKLDTSTPGDMRAPGAVIGQFASESAMDELSYALQMDPIALRLANYTEHDENADKKFTSKALRECYSQGAEAFGWAKRSPQPRSMRDGKELIGWGMAAGVWEALVMATAARVAIAATGKVTVSSATADIGTGTYTVMAQTAADALGLPLEAITVALGDSDLPRAPVEGGSWGAASTCSAIELACDALKKELAVAADEIAGQPLRRASARELAFAGGRIMHRDDTSAGNDGLRGVALVDVVRASGQEELIGEGLARPALLDTIRYKSYTHSALFCEVRVDEDLGLVRVTRLVNAVAAGRILNPKTARSQILGGLVMGIGSALTEETVLDHRLGRFMNHNFAEYHVPAHADVQGLEVIFVTEEDEKTSPIGAKGLGEIGIVGTAAAIANAVFHATGRRVRDLPITVEKVLDI